MATARPVTPTAALAPQPAAATGSSYTTAADPMPTPEQVHIGIKILSKQCFGSAGCNITYQIQPSHSGVGVLHPASLMLVVYEVTGGKDGPIINYFSVEPSGALHMRPMELVTTASQATVLTARATSVSEG